MTNNLIYYIISSLSNETENVMYTMKFKSFAEWIDSCVDAGFLPSEIQEDNNTYEFRDGSDVLAYWDRDLNIGAVCVEVYS